MNILYVGPEDEVAARIVPEFIRRRHAVRVKPVPSDALETLRTTAVDVVVCALGHATAAFLKRAAGIVPDAFRIAVMTTDRGEELIDAVNRGGANHIITASTPELGVETALPAMAAHRQAIGRQHSVLQSATDWVRCLETRIADANQTADLALEDVLIALVSALDMRENESANHSRRVAMFSLFLANHIGLESGQWEWIFRGGLLHDVGKIGVRDEVLLKPGALTPDERRQMEQHVPIGVRMLSQVGLLRPALPIPQYHHEHYDGRGYGEGIGGEDIPEAARMFTVIDVYDALCNVRPYKRTLSHDAALAVISMEAGTHFDPRIVEGFASVPAEQWQAVSAQGVGVRSYSDALLACHKAGMSAPATADIGENADEGPPLTA